MSGHFFILGRCVLFAFIQDMPSSHVFKKDGRGRERDRERRRGEEAVGKVDIQKYIHTYC